MPRTSRRGTPVVNDGREFDLWIRDEGSLFLVEARTPLGSSWLEDFVDPDHQEWCGKVVVEHRYIGELAQGAIDNGLFVGGN